MKYLSRPPLFQAILMTLLLSIPNYSSAQNQIYIYAPSGVILDYDDTVNINAGDSETAIYTGRGGTVNFKKDVNITSSGRWPIVGTWGNINIGGTLNINVDSTGASSERETVALATGWDADRLHVDKYNITMRGGKDNFLVGAMGEFRVQNGNIDIQAINAGHIYGYWENGDARVMGTHYLVLSGQHNVNIDSTNGREIIGIYKAHYDNFYLPSGTNVNVNIKDTNDGSVKWSNTEIQGIRGYLKMAANSSANIKIDMSTAATSTAEPMPVYYSTHTPAGIYVNRESTYTDVAVNTYMQAGSRINIDVSGPPIWNTYDMYAAKLGLGSIVGFGTDNHQAIIDSELNINVRSPQGVGVRIDDSFLTTDSKIELNGNTIITTNNGYALMSESITSLFQSERYSGYNSNYSTTSILVNKNGGSLVQLIGDLDHRTIRDSYFNINLDRPESFLTGASYKTNAEHIFSNAKGTTDIRLANSAAWNMTANSIVNELTFANKGFLNMTPSGVNRYEILTANRLLGNDGKLLLNTDLQQSFNTKDTKANSDRLVITTASSGTHTIDVKDASMITKVPAEGYLLLVEDHSQGTATFVGGNLLKGGIFKYKPIITSADPNSYSNVPANSTNWYLTGFEKIGVADEVYVDSGLAESRYIAYMNEQDTLIKRLGELRQHDKEKGVWVRTKGANNSVNGLAITRNSYVSTYIGYDWRLDDEKNTKRYRGVALNHTNNNFDYIMGATGKGQANVLTLYATNISDKGHYWDVVGKLGRMSNDYTYQGQKTSLQNWFHSLSLEYGRSITRKNGWYYEPQVQLTLGQIDSATFIDNNGTSVYADSIASGILRAGVLFGRKFNEDKPEKNGNYYAKLFWSHEFGGNVKATMSDSYGDRLNVSHSYSGSWLTFGLGTSLNLNKKTNLYLDVEKAFGGKVSGGWAWQGGLRWRFN